MNSDILRYGILGASYLISSLSEKKLLGADKSNPGPEKGYRELIPKLNELRSSFKNLHVKAVSMTIRLENI
mgnify:CR=1 FL=1